MYTRDIKHWIVSLKEEEIFLAKEAYLKYFSNVKEATFYQLLARLNNEKYLGKIAKGLYYKPNIDNFDKLPSDEKLLNFFINKNKSGMITGEKMFNSYNIIDSNNNIYEIYTNAIEIKTVRNMSNLKIQYLNVDFKDEGIRNIVEFLDTIEYIDLYENVNQEKLYEFLKTHAKNYNEDDLFIVLEQKNYKKRNLATLKEILDYFKVKNNLSRILNTASRYLISPQIKKALSI